MSIKTLINDYTGWIDNNNAEIEEFGEAVEEVVRMETENMVLGAVINSLKSLNKIDWEEIEETIASAINNEQMNQASDHLANYPKAIIQALKPILDR